VVSSTRIIPSPSCAPTPSPALGAADLTEPDRLLAADDTSAAAGSRIDGATDAGRCGTSPGPDAGGPEDIAGRGVGRGEDDDPRDGDRWTADGSAPGWCDVGWCDVGWCDVGWNDLGWNDLGWYDVRDVGWCMALAGVM
jgi:hypothetical protein